MLTDYDRKNVKIRTHCQKDCKIFLRLFLFLRLIKTQASFLLLPMLYQLLVSPVQGTLFLLSENVPKYYDLKINKINNHLLHNS